MDTTTDTTDNTDNTETIIDAGPADPSESGDVSLTDKGKSVARALVTPPTTRRQFLRRSVGAVAIAGVSTVIDDDEDSGRSSGGGSGDSGSSIDHREAMTADFRQALKEKSFRSITLRWKPDAGEIPFYKLKFKSAARTATEAAADVQIVARIYSTVAGSYDIDAGNELRGKFLAPAYSHRRHSFRIDQSWATKYRVGTWSEQTYLNRISGTVKKV